VDRVVWRLHAGPIARVQSRSRSWLLPPRRELPDRNANRRSVHVPVAAHVAEQNSVRLDADRPVTARDITPHSSTRNVPCSG
jgi:hypothetical protein